MIGFHRVNRTMAIVVAVVLLCSKSHAAIVITDFAPSSYIGGTPAALQTMRQNLGISGFYIEDFANISIPTIGPLLFTGTGVLDVVAENGNSWGQTGTGFMRVITGVGTPAIINIAGGTSAIGFGFSSFESGTQGALTSISINGGLQIPLNSTTLPRFAFTSTVRNGYIVISTDPGDPLIQSVELTQSGNPDGYQLDYFALGVTAVPEPSSMTLSAIGLAVLGIRRHRRKNVLLADRRLANQ